MKKYLSQPEVAGTKQSESDQMKSVDRVEQWNFQLETKCVASVNCSSERKSRSTASSAHAPLDVVRWKYLFQRDIFRAEREIEYRKDIVYWISCFAL